MSTSFGVFATLSLVLFTVYLLHELKIPIWAKSGNLGESSTALESVTRERIESVSQQFFTEIWGLGESRQRGAPSYEYKKRVAARLPNERLGSQTRRHFSV